MARSKLRVTGFTRFFLVMIIVIPLAYLGASYYNGEDGLGNIKKWLGIEQTTQQVEDRSVDPSPTPPTTREDTNTDLIQQQLDYYKSRVEDLEAENNRLRQSIWEKEQELSRLRQGQ